MSSTHSDFPPGSDTGAARGSASSSGEIPTSLSTPNTSPGRILVVDDVPTNVRLLSVILGIEGFEVIGANNGAEALAKLHGSKPHGPESSSAEDAEDIDVVLLDVMMPHMDGFEVCQRIRAHPATASLPVVMVTALQDTTDRVRALEAGADDFLAKPIDETEVVARVRSLVRAKRDRAALEGAYRAIRAAEELRHFLTEMLVHDLRTPLTTVLASLNMLDTGMVGQLAPVQQEVVAMCSRGGQHLLGLVNELLDISRMEGGEMPLQLTELDAEALIRDAISHTTTLTRHEGGAIHVEAAPDLPSAWADEDLLRRVLINLLGNALKFAHLQSPVLVTIETRNGPKGHEMLWSIRDDGEGIAQADQERIFSKFGQAQNHRTERRTSSGLGLTFCKLAVEAHGGRIWVESTLGEGSTFCFSLPLLNK